MSLKRRKFERRIGKRRYRKLFIIAVEGAKTERAYFNVFNFKYSLIKVKCLEHGHASSPEHVLKRMTGYLREEHLFNSDEAWLVVDKDQWKDEQLTELRTWSKSDDRYGFALSNPKFEYWLLLHFEDGADIASSQECSNRLRKYLPNYDKKLTGFNPSENMIEEAIRRAKKRDNPPCEDWPRSMGGTTVYKLVERIIESTVN